MVFVFFCLDDVSIWCDGRSYSNTFQDPTVLQWWKSNFWQQQESQAAVWTELANFEQNIFFNDYGRIQLQNQQFTNKTRARMFYGIVGVLKRCS